MFALGDQGEHKVRPNTDGKLGNTYSLKGVITDRAMTRDYGDNTMLKQQQGRPSTLDNERLYSILEKVDAVLTERRTRQTLVSELLTTQNDIEFLENKISMATHTLHRQTPELETLKDRSEKTALLFAALLKEREAAETKYFRLKRAEREFKANVALLPKINEEISALNVQVSQLKRERETQEARLQEVLSQKVKFQSEIDLRNQRMEALALEIPVIKNTRDIILGLMPPDFDTESFEALDGGFEKNLNDYTNEINQEIQKIQDHISDLNERIEKERQHQVRLLSEEADLKNKYDSMSADIDGETDKSKLMAELNQLIVQKNQLSGELDRLHRAIDAIHSDITGLDEQIEQEKANQAELKQRYAYLESVKQEMNRIGDISAQIQFQKETQANLAAEADVLNRKIDFINKINPDIDAVVTKLQAIVDDHHKQWLEFFGPSSELLF